MKRDMDVIRQIVLAAREANDPLSGLDGMDSDVFASHVILLEEAGLVKATSREQHGKAFVAVLYRLTWTGHDFADAIKEDNLWRKAKETVLKPTASWTFGILVDYLKGEISSRLPGALQEAARFTTS